MYRCIRRIIDIAGNLFIFRDATGKFPEYPTEEEGGSAAIFVQKDPAQVLAPCNRPACQSC